MTPNFGLASGVPVSTRAKNQPQGTVAAVAAETKIPGTTKATELDEPVLIAAKLPVVS